jgi:hypothetical protein
MNADELQAVDKRLKISDQNRTDWDSIFNLKYANDNLSSALDLSVFIRVYLRF